MPPMPREVDERRFLAHWMALGLPSARTLAGPITGIRSTAERNGRGNDRRMTRADIAADVSREAETTLVEAGRIVDETRFEVRHFRVFQGGLRLASPAVGATVGDPSRIARGGRVSVLAYVLASDDRLSGRILEWRPPRWVWVWMLAATRLGDGWLWLAAAAVLVASGNRGLPVLSAGAVSAGLANVLLFCIKGRVRRARPCGRANARHLDVDPLGWLPSDRFSFPSGHALNAFAIGSVIALAFPLVALPVLGLAGSVAASRVVLRLHWLSDVLVGALVGLFIGISVWLALLQ